MKLGPITPSIIPTNPLKPLRAKTHGGRQVVSLDATYPYSLQSDALEYTIDVVAFGKSPNNSREIIQQLIELGMNAEWHRCGIYLTLREDGVQDASDGWYIIGGVDITELSHDKGWAVPKIDVAMRAKPGVDIGVFVDSKLQPNSIGLGGNTLAALPQGVDATQLWPAGTSFTMLGADGSSIVCVHNPPPTAVAVGGIAVVRAPLTTPGAAMTLGRCAVFDQTLDGTTSNIEVFFKDHRWQNAYCRITNQLLRYTLHLGDTAPLIEVWNASASAWQSLGNFQLQSYAGSAYTTLPLRGFDISIISPEEVIWEERRYDLTNQAMVRVVNRIRRGSRLIECQVVAASGAGLTGAQSVGITNCGATGFVNGLNAAAAAACATGPAVLIPGFAFLDVPANATSVAGSALYSGISIPAGSVGRFSIICGIQDNQYLYNWFAPPSLVSVTQVGTPGAKQFVYAIAQLDGYTGASPQGPTTTTNTGATTLNATNYNLLTAPPGYFFDYYRISNNAGYANGYIGTRAGGTPLADQGQAPSTPPVRASAAIYASHWGTWNLFRVKQRILI